MRKWLACHSVWQHLAAPVWSRIPEKHRWTVVHWLNRSSRRCWSHLVDDALTCREEDACDTNVPSLRGSRDLDCARTCHWLGGRAVHDHEGEHDCRCYCGKFQFRATEGADDRKAAL